MRQLQLQTSGNLAYVADVVGAQSTQILVRMLTYVEAIRLECGTQSRASGGMPPANVQNVLVAAFAVNCHHYACGAQQAEAIWFIKIATGDMEILVAVTLLALEEVPRKIGARDCQSNLRGARLNPTTMRCCDHYQTADVS